MSNTINGGKKIEVALNYRYWKKRIYLILENNKVLNLVKGNVKKASENLSDGEKEIFIENELMAMTNGRRNKVAPFLIHSQHRPCSGNV